MLNVHKMVTAAYVGQSIEALMQKPLFSGATFNLPPWWYLSLPLKVAL